MASDSEHTNRPRPPQQAQGRKWPTVVLLLSVVTLALATACGGDSSTSTPGATTGSPATATSSPASTPTPEPTEAAAVSESAEINRETREYIEAQCALSIGKQEPATYGDLADVAQEVIDFAEKNEPPEELRDYMEAQTAAFKLILRFAREHRSVSLEDEKVADAFNNEELKEALNTAAMQVEVLDDAVATALSCS